MFNSDSVFSGVCVEQVSRKKGAVAGGVSQGQGRLALVHDIEGFLICADSGWDPADALRLMCTHLDADLLQWVSGSDLSSAAQQVEPVGTSSLVVADLRGELTLEKVATFEDEVLSLANQSGGQRIFKLAIISPGIYRRLKDFLTQIGYIERNHFIMGDILHLLRLDPDFWLRGRALQVGRQEERIPLAISDELLFLMETYRWRFGWLELDLFLREAIRRMPVSRILGLGCLPKWFKNPSLPLLERKVRDSLSGFGVAMGPSE